MPRLVLAAADPAPARALRDAGHEVVLLDGDAPADEVAAVAVQEDVVAVAVVDTELGAAVADRSGPGLVVFSVT